MKNKDESTMSPHASFYESFYSKGPNIRECCSKKTSINHNAT